MADIIDPILTVQNYCQATALYVQGVVVQDRAFLSTNLNPQQTMHVTLCGQSWLMGQGAGCALSAVAPGIDPDHALLRFDPCHGFALVDLGSEGGTCINQRRLIPGRPYSLQDGDLIEMGELKFEFFQEFCVEPAEHPEMPLIWGKFTPSSPG
ncbi:MAG: FHA domain-containing protein [Leptolyngbyaceae cyanobacterium SM2_3_12]|nr:FHA domain-containing protein [Leptolyngbyaceae cyanobacterium SM2_3_12]